MDGLTLHQLSALLVLLQERSVTRAAARLGVTQPALSHTLRALRERLGDPLLVPGAGGMVRTARAELLAPQLARLLRELEVTLGSSGTEDPRAWTQRVVLGTWDGFPVTLLPALLTRIATEAPGLDVDVRPLPPEGSAAALEEGRLDLAVEVRPRDAPGLRQRTLADDTFSCAVRSGNPQVGAELDLDTYCALPHVLISPQGEGVSVVDRLLAEQGRSRHVALRIRYFLAAPMVVAHSDLVLTAPTSLCVAMAGRFPLRVLPPPLAIPRFRTHLVWHERQDRSPVHRWVRQALIDAVAAHPPCTVE